MRVWAFCLLVLGAGCASVPGFDGAEEAWIAGADYPRLVPLEQLLSGPDATLSPADLSAVEVRVAGLKARAARLRAVRPGPFAVENRYRRLQQRAVVLRGMR